MNPPRILLDEHVGRVIERVLKERGYDVEQAKDVFGEGVPDREVLQRCRDKGSVVLTNNAKDFEPLHRDEKHSGMILYRDQKLPDVDPEGLARAIEEVFDQYGTDGLENSLVHIDNWYSRLHGR